MKKIITILMAIVISIVGPVSVFATEIDETELLEENNNELKVSEISEIETPEPEDTETPLEQDNSDSGTSISLETDEPKEDPSGDNSTDASETDPNTTVSENSVSGNSSENTTEKIQYPWENENLGYAPGPETGNNSEKINMLTAPKKDSGVPACDSLDDVDVSEDYYFSTLSEPYDGASAPKLAIKPDNQEQAGLCWMYAPLKAMEFNILLHGGDKYNLSEKLASYYFWHPSTEAGSEANALDGSYNEIIHNNPETPVIPIERACYGIGGREETPMTFFSAWRGLADESEDPANSFNGENKSSQKLYFDTDNIEAPSKTQLYSDNAGHVQNILTTSSRGTDEDNITAIKKFVKKYGAGVTSVFSSSGTYGKNSNAWYENVSTNRDNHMVTIVGWDDNYSKSNFQGTAGKPSTNGAWYCLNSWGTKEEYLINPSGCDENGGFWLSYECVPFVTSYDVYSKSADTPWYDHNYIGVNGADLYPADLKDNFDTNIMRGAAGNRNVGMEYEAEGSISTEKEKVRAVGFYNMAASNSNAVSYTLKVYKGSFDNKELMSEQTFSTNYVGHHTIELDHPFIVNKGEKFYAEISWNKVYYGNIASTKADVTDDRYDIAGLSAGEKSDSFKLRYHSGSIYGVPYADGAVLEDYQPLINVYTSDYRGDSVSSILGDNITLNAAFGDAPKNLKNSVGFAAGEDEDCRPTKIISCISSDPAIVSADVKKNTLTIGNAGTATITTTTSDGIVGVLTVTVSHDTIVSDNVTLDKTSFVTDGTTRVTPDVTVTCGGTTLTAGSDYTVSYGENIAEGTGTVKVTGKGNYSGTVTKIFTIVHAKASTFTNSEDKTFYYDCNNKWEAGSLTIPYSDIITFVPGLTLEGSATAIQSKQFDESAAENRALDFYSPYGMRLTKDNFMINNLGLSKHTALQSIHITFKTTDNISATVKVTVQQTNMPAEENNEPIIEPDPTPAPTPQPKPEETEKKDETKKTVALNSNGIKAEISMKKEVPYSNNKKAIASSCGVSLSFKEGSGLSIKSVKASKPKNGSVKVTIKLSGSSKEAKKAAKQLNKTLKNISVSVIKTDISKASVSVTLNGKKTKVTKVTVNGAKLKSSDYSASISGSTVKITGSGNYTGTYTKNI